MKIDFENWNRQTNEYSCVVLRWCYRKRPSWLQLLGSSLENVLEYLDHLGSDSLMLWRGETERYCLVIMSSILSDNHCWQQCLSAEVMLYLYSEDNLWPLLGVWSQTPSSHGPLTPAPESSREQQSFYSLTCVHCWESSVFNVLNVAAFNLVLLW